MAHLVEVTVLVEGTEQEGHLDLARAIEISTTNKELLEQEKQILHSIVSLSDISVEECMRPRTQLVIHDAQNP